MKMKTITFVFAGFVLFSTVAYAAETMNADAVKELISGNTVHGLAPNGNTQKNYFSPDGKTYRQAGGKILEGTWRVNDDGTQCVEGMPGGCATIVRNDDGTYDRVTTEGGVRLKWTSVVKGKDF
jgi:hypothetical protein